MAAPFAVPYSPIQNIALRLPVNQAPSETVPYDLQRWYSRDVWVARQRAVLNKASRYMKPRFEYIFAIFMLLASFAVPVTVYYVLLNVLPEHDVDVERFDGRVVAVDDQRFWQARAASIGAFLGLLILGWVPFFLWKAHGKRQVNEMLRKFSAEDAAFAGPGAQAPQCRAIHLIISYPRPYAPTPYAPGAQLPPYLVNPPQDPAANAFYAPYMASGHHDEKIPEYTGPAYGTYLPHEKEGFEDVKV
ncbi:hypothetical protein BD414DRAFT_504191 [Trametes punicea]|nr:hypothetical protein BD414DRAFT_504191 [Trametes punicea]